MSSIVLYITHGPSDIYELSERCQNHIITSSGHHQDHAKPASIFIWQIWQATKTAIGSTMLAAHSNSTNSKKSAQTKNKKLTSWPLHTDI